MKVFVHFILDHFGIKLSRRFRSLLENVHDESSELHLFIWSGIGPTPVRSNYWRETLESWDGELTIPCSTEDCGEVGYDLDRNVLAKQVKAFLIGETGRSQLRMCLIDLVKNKLGAGVPVEIFLIFEGALANPETSAIQLGFWAAFEQLHQRGIGLLPQSHQIWSVFSTGAMSGDLNPENEWVRVLVAQSLIDFGVYMRSQEVSVYGKNPIYLVGENQAGSIVTDLETQMALASMLLLGLSRSCIDGFESVYHQQFNPFRFVVNNDGVAEFCNEQFIGECPFSSFGGYMALCSEKDLSDLLAMRFCKTYFLELQKQTCATSLEQCELIPLDHMEEQILSECQEIMMRHVKNGMQGTEGGGNFKTITDSLNLPFLKQMVDPVFCSPEWNKTIEVYGFEYIKTLPLEDWGMALEELDDILQGSLIPRRLCSIKERIRMTLTSVYTGILMGVDHLFTSDLQRMETHQPHRRAQAFMGQLYRQLKKCQEELDQNIRYESHRALKLKDHSAGVDNHKKVLLNALSDIPSPFAVYLRLLPLGALLLAIPQLIPDSFLFSGGFWIKMILGTILGIGGPLILYLRHVEKVKKNLGSLFMKWFERFKLKVETEEEIRRIDTQQEILSSLNALLSWMFNGEGEQLPLPEYPIFIEKNVIENSQSYPDSVPIQTVFSGFPNHLEKVAKQYEESEENLKKYYQKSLAEMVLPEVSIGNEQALDREFMALLATEDSGKKRLENYLRHCVSYIKEIMGQSHSEKDFLGLFPYLDVRESKTHVNSECSVWRRSFLLPSGEDLLAEETRKNSSAYVFWYSLKRYIQGRFKESNLLPSRIKEYMDGNGFSSISDTPLYQRWSAPDLSMSSNINAGKEAQYIMASGPDDLLAMNVSIENSKGRDRLSIHMLVRVNLNSDDIIFVPNEINPVSPLGQTWKAYKHNLPSNKVFVPVVLAKGDEE